MSETKTYWRSLEELADTPEFQARVANEFPSQLDALVDPLSRRRFLQVMGASMALSGLTGCDVIRWPKEPVLPYARRPMERTPGLPVMYATSMELAGVATGLLVKSYDGRPIKVEGNPEHPASLGAAGAHAQASVLQLYDPDRSRGVAKSGALDGAAPSLQASSWAEFEEFVRTHFQKLREQQGEGLSILTEASGSPTLAAVRSRLAEAFPRLKWHVWEPVSRDNELEASRLALGGSFRTQLQLDRAKVIVSLDGDPLHFHPNATRYSRDFIRGRRPDEGQMSRLYAVESNLTLTGTMADHRLALQPGQVESFALLLASALVADEGLQASAEVRERLAAFQSPAEGDFRAGPAVQAMLKAIVADLLAHRGESLVVVGPRQPAAIHAVGHLLNRLLGNVGATLRYTAMPNPDRSPHVAAIRTLVDDMKNGRVDTLVVLGANPVYSAPADLDFAETYTKNVPHRIHLGLYRDETALRSTWHLPRSHYLEAWGDARSWDGTISLVQPLIAPLFEGRSAIEVLAVLGGFEEKSGYDIVRRALRGSRSAEAFEPEWQKALHDGFLAGSTYEPQQTTLTTGRILEVLADWPRTPRQATREALDLILVQDAAVHDGRFANVSWLQELPDPLTKLTWDNALLMSPDTAAGFGVAGDQVVRLSHKQGEREYTLSAPVYILPGLPEWTVVLSLGYGRQAPGLVVAHNVGFDSYRLLTTTAPQVVQGVRLEPTAETYLLATTQDHHSITTPIGQEEVQKRIPNLVREATLEEFKARPAFARKVVGPVPETTQLWEEPVEYDEQRHKWGMAIDLSRCTGCSACVVACQAENNIPVVGKSEVARGREMHWLRIDRYFKGDPRAASDAAAAPPGPLQVVHQPLPCMQCENAPCESVCPVAATTHSDDGLNDMVYNRCVGTRYCANNCPYKVRRFNYFYNYHGPFHPRSLPVHKYLPKPAVGPVATAPVSAVEQMVFNPEVTVRARGVMEKCTFCVQRIRGASIQARNKGQKRLLDGQVQTACQQACPTEAIVFGDLADPEARVTKMHALPRTYSLLWELNTRPRTQYQARITNPRAE